MGSDAPADTREIRVLVPAMKAVGIKQAIEDMLQLYGVDHTVRIATDHVAHEPSQAPAETQAGNVAGALSGPPGKALKTARTAAGLTQAALARAVGIKRHHVSEMEHGKRPIGKNMAHRLAKVFKADYKAFL